MSTEQLRSSAARFKPKNFRARWDAACNRPALDDIASIEIACVSWDAESRAIFYRALAIRLALQVDGQQVGFGETSGPEQRPVRQLLDDPHTLELLLLSDELMGLAGQENLADHSGLSRGSHSRARMEKLMHFLAMLTDGVMDSVSLARRSHAGNLTQPE